MNTCKPLYMSLVARSRRRKNVLGDANFSSKCDQTANKRGETRDGQQRYDCKAAC